MCRYVEKTVPLACFQANRESHSLNRYMARRAASHLNAVMAATRRKPSRASTSNQPDSQQRFMPSSHIPSSRDAHVRVRDSLHLHVSQPPQREMPCDVKPTLINMLEKLDLPAGGPDLRQFGTWESESGARIQKDGK